MAGPQSSYSIKGLQNAHALGMSWRSIALVVGGMVLLFVLVTAFAFNSSKKNTDQIQADVNKTIQKATEDAQKQQLQMQADIQKQIEANLKKSQSGN